MPRPLSATGSPAGHLFDSLTFLKSAFAVATFLTTLLIGIYSRKLLTWSGEKLILTISYFAAGIFLGTAMLELLSLSDILCHELSHSLSENFKVVDIWTASRYPLVFLLWCAGYLVAMLADCMLARVVRRLGRVCFRKSHPKFIDKMMLSLVSDLQPIKCCEATLPVGTSMSDPKDCDSIGYLQCLILDRAILLVDGSYVFFILSLLSQMGGCDIWTANTHAKATRAFLKAILQNIIYTISITPMLLRFFPSSPFSEWFSALLCFSFMSPAGVIDYFLLHSSVISSTPPADTTDFYWFSAIFTGFSSGFLVYLSAHHLLTDGYELTKSVPETRFGKFVAVICGVGLAAFLNVY